MQAEDKRGSTSLALKAGFWYVVSTFMVKGLSFITTPIFARLMNSEDYGEFANFASWETLLLIIVGVELYNTVARAYYDFKEDFDQYISAITISTCFIAIALYVVFLISKSWIFKIVSIPEEYIHILFFTLMFMACKQIYFARERTLYRYKSVAALSVVNITVPTIIAAVAVICAEESQRLSARIYGFYLPSALVGVGCAIVMLIRSKKIPLKRYFKYLKYALVLSIPLLLHYLTAHLLTSTNTIVTKNVLGAGAVSIVSVASSANHILTILLQSVSGALTTWLMDNLEQEKAKTTGKGTLFYVIGISAVAVGVILLAPEIIWFLGGKKYADSVTLMPGMVTATLIQSITTVFTIILTYKKSVAKTAVYTMIVAILCIVSKFLLLPILGVQILPFINIAAFAILYLINYILVRRQGCGEYVNFKGITFVILVVLAAMAVSYILYEHTILRYGFILCGMTAAAFVAYKNRQFVIKLIKRKFKKKTHN